MVVKKYGVLHDVLAVYTLILVVWGFYRLLFRLPVWLEELVLKPIVFGLPVVYRLAQEEGKSWWARWESVGLVKKNLGLGVVLGLALGVFYLLMGRLGVMLREGSMGNWDEVSGGPMMAVVLAVATAMSEQLVFMGYILPRLKQVWRNEWLAVGLTGIMFGLIHLPLLVFGYRLPLQTVVGQFWLALMLGWGNGIVMLRVGNLVTPILSQALWGMAVVIFG